MQCVDFIGNEFWLVYEVSGTDIYPNCSGSVVYDSVQTTGTTGTGTTDGGETGTTSTTIVVYEAQPPFDPSTIDTAAASTIFGAGFLLALGPIVPTYVIRTILSMIRN